MAHLHELRVVLSAAQCADQAVYPVSRIAEHALDTLHGGAARRNRQLSCSWVAISVQAAGHRKTGPGLRPLICRSTLQRLNASFRCAAAVATLRHKVPYTRICIAIPLRTGERG